MDRDKKDGVDERDRFAREAMEHLDHLYRVAVHLAKEPDQAQDLVQETYARAFNAQRQFIAGTNLKAWLTKILYNFFFDHYQERKKWVFTDTQDPTAAGGPNYWESVASSNPGPEKAFLQSELREKISAALRELPDEYRLPLVLVDMGDLSYADAAEILSCPIGTVRSRLSRGRRLMRTYLASYLEIERSGEKRK